MNYFFFITTVVRRDDKRNEKKKTGTIKETKKKNDHVFPTLMSRELSPEHGCRRKKGITAAEDTNMAHGGDNQRLS